MPENDLDPGPENDLDTGRENDLDPGASTQMFQAFVDRHEPEESGAPWMRAGLVGAAVVGLALVSVFAWRVLSG